MALTAISNATSAYLGDTVLLACVGYGIPELRVSWFQNGQPLSNTSTITIFEPEVVRGSSMVAFLQLCNLQDTAGAYTCELDNGVTIATASTQLTVLG